jgi:hypothetical protein
MSHKQSLPDSAAEKDRIHLLHEAICRCVTCRGTTDKTKLCRVCAANEHEIEKLVNAGRDAVSE